jgi:preprotein translocase subunit SecE
MDNNNSKIMTLSFAIAGALAGLSLSLLIKSFSGAFGIIARMADTDLVRHGLPVVVGLGLFLVLQFNSKVLAWGDEVVTEIRKVVWPSQKDMSAMTMVVVAMVLISSAIVTGFDAVSGFIITHLMQ